MLISQDFHLPESLHHTSCSISFTLDTLFSFTSQNSATISICSQRYKSAFKPSYTHPHLSFSGIQTYTLLHQLHILRTHTHPPRSAQMPRRLVPQVLDHDSRKHYQFRIDSVEDAVVGEIEAISDVSCDPGWWG